MCLSLYIHIYIYMLIYVFCLDTSQSKGLCNAVKLQPYGIERTSWLAWSGQSDERYRTNWLVSLVRAIRDNLTYDVRAGQTCAMAVSEARGWAEGISPRAAGASRRGLYSCGQAQHARTRFQSFYPLKHQVFTYPPQLPTLQRC